MVRFAMAVVSAVSPLLYAGCPQQVWAAGTSTAHPASSSSLTAANPTEGTKEIDEAGDEQSDAQAYPGAGRQVTARLRGCLGHVQLTSGVPVWAGWSSPRAFNRRSRGTWSVAPFVHEGLPSHRPGRRVRTRSSHSCPVRQGTYETVSNPDGVQGEERPPKRVAWRGFPCRLVARGFPARGRPGGRPPTESITDEVLEAAV